MPIMNSESDVMVQYASSDKLNSRIRFHAKYSINKQGFGNWIVGHYRFPSGACMLELGCGTGEMWLGRDELINRCARLVLSDRSEGMLETAKEKLRQYPGIEYEPVDIREIPFPDGSFDVVIANMMLYHVPEIDRALSEVRRVLRGGGTFYCATYGEHGMMEYLIALFKSRGIDDSVNHSFTLQNGARQLEKHFSNVQRYDYADGLAVTDVGDMADYILSLTGISALRNLPRETIRSVLEANAVKGILTVPKEYGLFVCE